MQSGSQLLSGSHRGSYVTKGLGMSWGMVRVFTLTEVIYRLDFAPQFTLSDPIHIGGFILMRMQSDGVAVPEAGLG